jgi:alpha-galactosidase
VKRILGLSLGFLILTSVGRAAEPTSQPAFWNFAQTPPMGWNSYDAFGDSVTEKEFLANVNYMHEHLQSHGWQYVVVDYRWYDPGAHDNNPNGRKGAVLTMDEFGRLLPSPNRFPSGADGKGFKPLADQVHALGLKFGIHVMRGIPRQAVTANTPIEGSDFHAADAANPKSICVWCPDMFGVDATKPAGKAWYDSIFRLYASWGVDLVKVDDLSRPYSTAEIEAIRSSIDKTGRNIVFSTSPGATPVAQADHIKMNANMWRISDDFWDQWKFINLAFNLLSRWQGQAASGHWPDADMIPFGQIGIRSIGKPRMTHFTHDEQITLMSLWSIAPSPLMLGANLPDNDEWTLSLLTNDEVLAVDQDSLGNPGAKISMDKSTEIWAKQLSNGRLAIGMFNRGTQNGLITLKWEDAKLTGSQKVRDLWQHKDLGSFDHELTLQVPKHGAQLLILDGK